MKTSYKHALTLLAMGLLVTGCAVKPKTVDYSAYIESSPRSILVLPPLNESPDVKATDSLLSQVTYPLAEAGYYVLPVTLVDETFRQNGLMTPNDIQAVEPAKLRDIFGADAAVYITITAYGAKYMVVTSATVVTASAKLVDLRTGKTLWTGNASASNDEGNNSGGGLLGMLVSAAIKQALNSATDSGHTVAGVTSQRLLSAGIPGGILYGPRSPKHGSD